MDERLIPINGLIALLRGDGGWPRPLGQAGFERHQFEVPLSSSEGDYRADALVYRRQPAQILLAECKSGRNINRLQAEKYLATELEWLKRSGAVPPALKNVETIQIDVLFVGRSKHRADLERGMARLEISAPLLTIGDDRIQLSGASRIDGIDDFIVDHEKGRPPGRIPIDHQSAVAEIREFLIPEVVAAQSGHEDIVAVEMICSHILPEWSVMSHGAKHQFIGRIAEQLKSLAAREFKGQIRYEHLKDPGTRGRLHILDSPARRDPRGRTQAFQSLQRKGKVALGRKMQRPQVPGQTSLDDLAGEAGFADE